MAKNPPSGDNRRAGAVRQRSQTHNPQNDRWVKPRAKPQHAWRHGTPTHTLNRMAEVSSKRGTCEEIYRHEGRSPRPTR